VEEVPELILGVGATAAPPILMVDSGIYSRLKKRDDDDDT